MNQVAIILPESLPMPPVLGGAVENLSQLIIEHNERDNSLSLLVYSKWTEQVKGSPIALNSTKYFYYKPNSFEKIIDCFLKVHRRLSRIIFKKTTQSLYEICLYKILKSNNIAKVVLANCPYYSPYLNRKGEFHIIQYLHNDYINSINPQTQQVLNTSQQYIAVSNFIKERLMVVCPQGTRIDVCYNGIDLLHFKEIRQEVVSLLRKKWNVGHGKVIVYAGRLADNKGVAELIEAFSMIADKHKDWKLVIIGATTFSVKSVDEYGKKLISLAQKVGEQVLFTGYVGYNDIPNYYNASDLCVIPSLQYESFNLVSVEAQASGLPVIVSDAGGIIETISNNSGVIVKRGEDFVYKIAANMERILENDAIYKIMSTAAKDNALRFPSSAMSEKFIKLIS